MRLSKIHQNETILKYSLVFSLFKISIVLLFTVVNSLNHNTTLINITTSEYVVTPDGQDTATCFTNTSGVSCKTVTYIIQNQCEQDTHLYIMVKVGENFTFTEPCWETMDSSDMFNVSNMNQSYPCRVTITGVNYQTAPQVVFKCNGSNETSNSMKISNILSYILTYDTSPRSPCSKSKTGNSSCNDYKLTLDTLVIKYKFIP